MRTDIKRGGPIEADYKTRLDAIGVKVSAGGQGGNLQKKITRSLEECRQAYFDEIAYEATQGIDPD